MFAPSTEKRSNRQRGMAPRSGSRRLCQRGPFSVSLWHIPSVRRPPSKHLSHSETRPETCCDLRQTSEGSNPRDASQPTLASPCVPPVGQKTLKSPHRRIGCPPEPLIYGNIPRLCPPSASHDPLGSQASSFDDRTPSQASANLGWERDEGTPGGVGALVPPQSNRFGAERRTQPRKYLSSTDLRK